MSLGLHTQLITDYSPTAARTTCFFTHNHTLNNENSMHYNNSEYHMVKGKEFVQFFKIRK